MNLGRERLGGREEGTDDLVPLGPVASEEFHCRVGIASRVARDALAGALKIRADGDASAAGEGVCPGIFGLDELESVVDQVQLMGCRRKARELVAARVDV